MVETQIQPTGQIHEICSFVSSNSSEWRVDPQAVSFFYFIPVTPVMLRCWYCIVRLPDSSCEHLVKSCVCQEAKGLSLGED